MRKYILLIAFAFSTLNSLSCANKEPSGKANQSAQLAPKYSVEVINDDNFNAKIAKGYSIVDFYGDWCGPCRRLGPIFEKVAKKHYQKLSFYKLNIDDSPSTASRYKVTSIPALLIFHNGEKVASRVGFMNESELEHFIDSNINLK